MIPVFTREFKATGKRTVIPFHTAIDLVEGEFESADEKLYDASRHGTFIELKHSIIRCENLGINQIGHDSVLIG